METKLEGVEHATLPTMTTRLNPVVSGDWLFASIFSPGSVCAVDRRTGDVRWTALDGLGGSAVLPVGETVFASTSNSLCALAAENGEVLWRFAPDAESGEWIYSQPVVHRGRVLPGDRSSLARHPESNGREQES